MFKHHVNKERSVCGWNLPSDPQSLLPCSIACLHRLPDSLPFQVIRHGVWKSIHAFRIITLDRSLQSFPAACMENVEYFSFTLKALCVVCHPQSLKFAPCTSQWETLVPPGSSLYFPPNIYSLLNAHFCYYCIPFFFLISLSSNSCWAPDPLWCHSQSGLRPMTN